MNEGDAGEGFTCSAGPSPDPDTPQATVYNCVRGDGATVDFGIFLLD